MASRNQPKGVSTFPSPVKLTRSVHINTKCRLWAFAAGRCEFPDCNRLVTEHSVTGREANLAEVAHVVAFSKKGPRGNAKRPKDVNALSNLMLLCPECHETIDARPGDFPVPLLREYKRTHEDRIRHLTGLRPDMATCIVQLKALIGGDAVDIPVSHVYEAVSPRWPVSTKGHVIDLGRFDVESDAGVKAAADQIDSEVAMLYRPGMEADRTRHISVFALAPIPLLMHLGARLSNKMPVDFYQRHRDRRRKSPWIWRVDDTPVDFVVTTLREGTDPMKVAVVLSLSGRIAAEALPPNIDSSFTLYEFSPKGVISTPTLLCCRETLERFRETYRTFLSSLEQKHGRLDLLHVFPSVPAPIAIVLGHDRLPKVHPDLLAYDNDKKAGGFRAKLTITRRIA